MEAFHPIFIYTKMSVNLVLSCPLSPNYYSGLLIQGFLSFPYFHISSPSSHTFLSILSSFSCTHSWISLDSRFFSIVRVPSVGSPVYSCGFSHCTFTNKGTGFGCCQGQYSTLGLKLVTPEVLYPDKVC